MQIDTKQKVISIQLRRLLTLVIGIAVALAVMLIGKLPHTFLGLNKYHWAIVVGVIYVLSVVIDKFWEYTYIFYSDETDHIVVRYFSLAYFNKRKQSIEIPKNEYVSFILKESFGGRKKKIILRRFYKNAEAQYPPISLTILNKIQLAEFLMSLNRFSKKK